MSDSASKAPQDFRALLMIACVFALVGGFTDAYSYLSYHRVFANAQTGNVVLFAVFASGRDWHQALHYLPPIGAFALGVATAKLLDFKMERHASTATVLCQGLECGVLFAIAVAGKWMPFGWAVPLLSFCSALQNTSFDAIGPWKFNTAMTTGNLRSAVAGATLWLLGKEPENNRRSAVVAFSVMGCFLMGGLLGGLGTRWLGPHSLGLCVVLVFGGLVLTLRERTRQKGGTGSVPS